MKNFVFTIILLHGFFSFQMTNNTKSFGEMMGYTMPDRQSLTNEFWHGSSSKFTANDSLVMIGEGTDNYFGHSVSDAGDVNNDGYADIIVGAYGHNNGRGRAYIFLGGTQIDNLPDIIISGIGSGSSSGLGISVSAAGDVNGDGYSDVMVSAPYLNYHTGCVYIYFGGTIMDNVADIVLLGEGTDNLFGMSVSNAGDLNGDGYSDVIASSYVIDNSRGRVYVYYGGANMNSIPDLTMAGASYLDHLGISVSNAGDFNGDGYSDIILGADGFNSQTGRSYLYFGGPSMDSLPDLIMTGERSNSNFGFSVSTAGDVNGDGYDDIVIGANHYRNSIGRAYIFHGGSSPNNVADVIITGSYTTQGVFGNSVSSAGDVNADGYSDIIVGSVKYFSGSAYVYYGGTNMDTIADVSKIAVQGTNPSFFGCSVSGAMDVNKDGFSDVVIGEEVYSNSYSAIGRAHLYTNLRTNILIPGLVFPLDSSQFNSTSIDFKWREVVGGISYLFMLSKDSTFRNLVMIDSVLFDTLKWVNGLNLETKYFWKVGVRDSTSKIFYSETWCFTTKPRIRANIKMLFEGMYYPIFNQMTRRDSVKVYLHQSIAPFARVDSASGTIDSLSFSGLFVFNESEDGNYYIVVNHLNCLEVWSKSGGENLTNSGSYYNYDFTSSASQAFGGNLKLKGIKYCIYSGDVDQSGFIDGSDLSDLDNGAYNLLSGRFLPTDLNGDNFTDGTDFVIGDNNRSFIGVITP